MKWPFSAYDLFAHVASGATIFASGAFAFDRDLGALSGAVEVSILSIASYTLGHIVAQISSALLEGGLARRILGGPETRLMQTGDGLLSRIFPGYFATLPEETRHALVRRLETDHAPTQPGQAMFLYCWSVARQDPDTRERLDSFLNLYGFCRNMAIATVLGAALVVSGAMLGHLATSEAMLVGVTLVLVSVVLVYRYLKFFRLYTREVFVRFISTPRKTT